MHGFYREMFSSSPFAFIFMIFCISRGLLSLSLSLFRESTREWCDLADKQLIFFKILLCRQSSESGSFHYSLLSLSSFIFLFVFFLGQIKIYMQVDKTRFRVLLLFFIFDCGLSLACGKTFISSPYACVTADA